MTRAVQPRRPLRFWTTVTAAALITALGPAASASAAPGVLTVGQAVVNTRVQQTVANDGGTKGDAALVVRQFRSDRARLDNRVIATAKECSDCRAVSFSLQIVHLNAEDLSLRATNLAQATNLRCVRCESMAAAYQIVLATGRAVLLDDADLQELDRIGRALDDLSRSPAPLTELTAGMDALVLQAVSVLSRALERPAADGAAAATGPSARAAGPSVRKAGPPVTVHRDVRVTGAPPHARGRAG